MKTILRYINRREWLFLLFAVLFVIASTWLETRIPAYMGGITQILQSESPVFSEVAAQGGMMLLMGFFSLMAALGSGYFIARFCGDYLMRLRQAVFGKTLQFSSREVGEFSTGGLISRCTSDVTHIQKFITGSAILLVKAPLTAIFVISRVSGGHPYWTISSAAAAILIAVLFLTVFIRVVPKAGKMHEINDRLVNVNREHISGIRVIHAFNAYRFQGQRLRKSSEEMRGLELFYNRHFALMSPATGTVMNLLSMAIYFTGAYIIAGATATEQSGYFASMAMFLSYGTQLVSAFVYLVMAAVGFPRMLIAVRRLAEVLNREPDIRDGDGVEPKAENRGKLEFRNVSFRYPGTSENALTDISFTAAPGETVAIIGATGSGKTALLDLIPRMYDVTEGSVLVDGEDVRNFRLKELRNRLGYVPQKGFLFSGSIAENIGKGENGRFEATLSQIKSAAQVGQADEFIQRKKGGYDAQIKRGGVNFSGGQRQRLSISRAICRDPEIYLFDDSFSALDFQTDYRLRQSLRETAKDATLVIVAQRVSTIMNADHILVLDRGRLVGSGRHEELMKSCEIYREIAISQIPEAQYA